MEQKPKMWFAVRFVLYQHGPIIHLIASISGVLCYLLARTVKAKICIDRESFAEVRPLEMVGDVRKWLRPWGEQLRSHYTHSLPLMSSHQLRQARGRLLSVEDDQLPRTLAKGNDRTEGAILNVYLTAQFNHGLLGTHQLLPSQPLPPGQQGPLPLLSYTSFFYILSPWATHTLQNR